MAARIEAETQAWLSTLSAEELALARDYTTGQHWLILASLVVAALVTWLIVRSSVLDKVAGRLKARGWFARTFLVVATYLIVSTLLTLPYTLYADWWREVQYGLSDQPLGDFLAQALVSLVVSTILGGLFLTGVYWLIRKAGRRWWIWGGGLVAGGIAFFLMISPMVIDPLFNEYEPIPEGEVRDAVLALASEAGVPEERVFMFDGSRQSNNFTANVSGALGTGRIAISDVAMNEASLDEVIAVTGHEIGHYVLGHIWRTISVVGLLAIAMFWIVDRTYPWFASRFGTDAAISDPRGLPVFMFVVSLSFALSEPLLNVVVRAGEREADRYSLEHARLPDALAGALIKTAEYRYPLAGPIEEAIFYSHPTVENRVRAAMAWKVANEGSAPGE